ncbi:uncharacterized protein LOC132943758 [Metopolophium dirhodum]|uniref:uncharacterized protein LOC132943758 n=1 Tax=Metopolophium dirhodum TaxID=44670 RepID=UPI00298FA665|nr:uncharacterized protein LOC132943758 [Metopolophium dirhodum]
MTKDTNMSAVDEESLFSDEELFANDANDCVVKLTSTVSYEDEYQSLLFQNRDRIITKLKNDLSNVLPPPPTVTTCRLSVNDILDRWYQHEKSNFLTKKPETKELKNIDRAINWPWPEVSNVQCFDVYYNIDNKSAEMALLETKYQQRYVSNETKSLMNTGFTPQPKKERGLVIQQVKPVEQSLRLIRRKPVSKPQILAEAKAKLALIENKRRILVPGKLKRENIKPLEKSYLENRNGANRRSISHKRALFQSPEMYCSRKRVCYSQNPNSEESSPLSALSICSDTSNTTPVKRWSAAPLSAKLFGDDQEDKQTSNITRTEPVKKCQRVLKFFNNIESATPKNLFNTKPNQKELSKLHKQKLLWAVSEVLKDCGVDSHHKQFRPFLQQLFKVCSKQWLQKTGSEIKTSTSEAMRALVMKHKSTVLKLKLNSPKHKDNVVTSKRKSVADVKKVLFIDTPKTDFKFEKFGSDLKTKSSTIENVVINKGINDFALYLDIKKLPCNKNTEDLPSRPVSSTSDYCSNLDIDTKDSERIFAG